MKKNKGNTLVVMITCVIMMTMFDINLTLSRSNSSESKYVGLTLSEAVKIFEPTPLISDKIKGHPRLFLQQDEIASLQQRAQGAFQNDWLRIKNQTISDSLLQSASLCYLITNDDVYLNIARKKIQELMSVKAWAGDPYDPDQNRDVYLGEKMHALVFAYDMLFFHLSTDEREAIRNQLAYNCRLTYNYYVTAKREWDYQQNHPYLPMTAMALVGYALYDEEPDAKEWTRLSECFLQRTLKCNGADGWYSSGWGYAKAVGQLATYAEAHYQMTGSKDALLAPVLRQMPTYLRHMLLPGGRNFFDFADCQSTYSQKWEREAPRAYDPFYFFKTPTWREKLDSGHPPSFRFMHICDLVAARFQDAKAQEVAEYGRKQSISRSYWSLLWKDPNINPASVNSLPTGYYFDDHEVAIWRSGWDDNATAVAIKCGPPLGHRNLQSLKEIPDLYLRAWHKHPDAGSFILFSKAEFLCTDTGYLHPKRSVDHNTILINGRGQEANAGHEAFLGVPYERLNNIRLNKVDIQEKYMFVEADMTAAYPPVLEMDQILRRFLVTDNCMVIWDILKAPYPHDYAWLLHTDTDYATDFTGVVNENNIPIDYRTRPGNLPGGYRTWKGNAGLQVNFLYPDDLEVDIERTVVITHIHSNQRFEGPPAARGHHLAARQHGSNCQYVTCLTWGGVNDSAPKVNGKVEKGKVTVLCEREGQTITLEMQDSGGKVHYTSVE